MLYFKGRWYSISKGLEVAVVSVGIVIVRSLWFWVCWMCGEERVIELGIGRGEAAGRERVRIGTFYCFEVHWSSYESIARNSSSEQRAAANINISTRKSVITTIWGTHAFNIHTQCHIYTLRTIRLVYWKFTVHVWSLSCVIVSFGLSCWFFKGMNNIL